MHTTRALLRKPGVDVDAENETGTTAMYIAAAHGHTAVVEVLADEAHADVSKSTPDDARRPPPSALAQALCAEFAALTAPAPTRASLETRVYGGRPGPLGITYSDVRWWLF